MTRPTLADRNRQLRQSLTRLPGSQPYDNYRPLNVPGRFDGQTLFECVCALYPHIEPRQWQQWFSMGHLLSGEEPVSMHRVVRGGEQFRHLFPGTVEPEINPDIKILLEDDAVIAVHKPAPLPAHPCGRFNLNSLTSLLMRVYPPDEIRTVHRLDANTTGVMLFARTVDVATNLRHQFQSQRVKKSYLVICAGHPRQNRFSCEAPITSHQGPAGSRGAGSGGKKAATSFRVLRRYRDGTSLLLARPRTGRTNQIRIHLWTMGMPVVGDPTYRSGESLVPAQTMQVGQAPMCLHAWKLRLLHPISGQPLCVAASPPTHLWMQK